MTGRNSSRRARTAGAAAALTALAALTAGCGVSHGIHAKPGTVVAIGAENEYANVIQQIGGKYVTAAAVMSNPNTDPHTFEASPSVARDVASAKLVVQNGAGYDDFMDKIESAGSSSGRTVINVQQLLGLPDSTANPHLWYSPHTMPAVATALVAVLSKLQPEHRAYFQHNAARFDASLKPWTTALAQFARKHPGAAVATTEPVADYMLQAAGIRNRTPFSMQADIMNGTDPAPEAVDEQNQLFDDHRVQVFVYNQQVTDTVTQNFLKVAQQNGIPVVGVYETMPTDGYNYQRWMMAELNALDRAMSDHASTRRL